MSEELYSKKLEAGSKTYFFDIKKAERGDKYVRIVERRRTAEKTIKNDITIFEDHAEGFLEALKETVEQLRKGI